MLVTVFFKDTTLIDLKSNLVSSHTESSKLMTVLYSWWDI